jgi:hypothetical protein
MTMQVAEGCGDLDGVHLSATYFKVMSEDKNFHAMSSIVVSRLG